MLEIISSEPQEVLEVETSEQKVGQEVRRVTKTTYRGAGTAVYDGQPYRADKIMYLDYGPGPAGGVTRCRGWTPDREISEEEREANREKIRAAAAAAMVARGIW